MEHSIRNREEGKTSFACPYLKSGPYLHYPIKLQPRNNDDNNNNNNKIKQQITVVIQSHENLEFNFLFLSLPRRMEGGGIAMVGMGIFHFMLASLAGL